MQTAGEEQVAFFGKLPARGDFVRLGAHGPGELSFAAWLLDAVECSQGVLPPGPVRFLFWSGTHGAITGRWGASRDAVGRSFPLTVSWRVPSEVERLDWPSTLAYFADVDEVVAPALAASAQADLPSLERVRAELVLPHESLFPALSRQAHDVATRTTVMGFARANLHCSSADALCYAMSTLQRAVALPLDTLTLDIPSSSLIDTQLWLELVRAALGPRHRPCVILWSPSQRRLLVNLGTLSSQLLSYLCNAEHRCPLRWPLWTDQHDAARVARAELVADVARCIARDDSLAELIERLRGAPP